MSCCTLGWRIYSTALLTRGNVFLFFALFVFLFFHQYYKRSSCGTFWSITLFWLLIWPKFSFTQISFFFYLLDIYNRYSLFLQFLSQLQLSILLVYWLSIEKERKPLLQQQWVFDLMFLCHWIKLAINHVAWIGYKCLHQRTVFS